MTYREIPMTDVNYPGFHLPNVVDPPDALCFVVRVPNDTWHIAAFLGTLHDLTNWFNWQRDDAKTGKEAARVWRDIWTSLKAQSCNAPTAPSGAEIEDFMPIRVDCDCNVFVTCCDGTEKQILTSAQVQALIQQQPGQGAPQPQAGGCVTYHTDLPANQIFLIPAPVNAGDTITIRNVVGAVHDNQVIDWSCPDGNAYFAGLCTTIVEPSQPLDPLSSANHGQLIVEIAGTFHALLPEVAFTVPSGIVNQQPTIQANLQLATASGSFQFDAQVCNNQAGVWCRELDFTVSNFGFLGQSPCTVPAGVWTGGVGWVVEIVSVGGGNYDNEVCISTTFSSPIEITDVEMVYDLTHGTHGTTGLQTSAILANSTVLWQTVEPNPPNGTGLVASWHGDMAGVTELTLNITPDQGNTPSLGGSGRIRSLQIKGKGAVPSIGTPC